MAQYIDVKSGEKLPNGDVSQFMTAMNKELTSVKEKGTTEGLTLQDKAHFLAIARNLTGAIEYYTKLWSAEIANQEDKFEFKDLGLIVSSKAGGSTSEISSEIFDVLTVEEIKKVAKVAGLVNLCAVLLLLTAGIVLFFTVPSFMGNNGYNSYEGWALSGGYVIAGILYIVSGAVAVCPAVVDFVSKK